MMFLTIVSSLVSAQGVGHGGGVVPILIMDLTESGVTYNITPTRLKFEFEGAPYAIQLREIEQEYAKFLVMVLNASDPDNILAYTIDDSFILVPSETREIDIDHDGKNDLFIQLKGITYIPPNNIRGANFFIKKITIPSVIIPEEKANDLPNYPNFLIKDGKLEVTTVVGDKSSSSNVLAQTYIVSSLSSLGREVNIENKLASEIEDLNQNIISIGNACVNKISAEIMNNPEPCDKDFPKGKGYIKLYKYNDFLHLIVAGYTDVGTKKMAEILSNYENYNLKGNVFEIEVEEIESKDSMQIEEEQEEKTKKIVEKSKETLEEVQEMGEKEPIEKETANQTEEKEPLSASEETSFIKRIFLWIASLFR